jgi:adenylate cyclase
VVIQEIIASGEDPRAEIGQHREVTTMFADLKGFTGLSESAPPELVVARLNEYLGRMIDVIFNHQGTLDKFIGDAIMSFWGAPLADPLQGLRSVRCAMAMHQGVEILGQEWRQQGKHELTFSTRIGINTGKVIVGNIGSEKHLSYTVIGDQVNLASRLEGLTRYYGVTTLVGERTAELIRGEICCRLIERRVIVKGKAEHVKVFEPLCELSAPDAAVLRELAGRFEEALELYREGKFEWARRLFHELATGRPGGDVPSRLYVERCEQLIAKPPREWDGTYVATSK